MLRRQILCWCDVKKLMWRYDQVSVYLFLELSKRTLPIGNSLVKVKMALKCEWDEWVPKHSYQKISINLISIWAIYNDLSQGHLKWWFSKAIPAKNGLTSISFKFWCLDLPNGSRAFRALTMVAFAPPVTFFSLLRVAECDSFSQGRRNQQKKKTDLTWWLPVMSTRISKMGFNRNQRYLSIYIYTCIFEIICTPARYTICMYKYIYISMYVYTYTVEYSPLSTPGNCAICYPSGGGRVGSCGIDSRIARVGRLVFVVN